MIRHVNRSLVLLVLLYSTLQVPLARAEGGLVLQPYWTFDTESPVTHVQAGDINGDGVKDVVVVTADKWVRVLENDGDLIWGYETLFVPSGLLVDDLDGDGQAAEIIVYGEGQEILLSPAGHPIWTYVAEPNGTFNSETAVDLNGDGRIDVVGGSSTGVVYAYDPSTSRALATRSIGTQEQTVAEVWVGDIDGDRRPEIVSRIEDFPYVFVLEDDLSLAWTQRIDGVVGLVQGGDVDGDGQAEVAVLTTSWDLFLLQGDGHQVWHDDSLSVMNTPGEPVPGQLIVHDLDGDSRSEIVVMASIPSAAVYVFDGAGDVAWQHRLEAVSTTAKLTAADIQGDGKAEVLVTTQGEPQVYLLGADGQRLSEYRTQATSGAFDYIDLNGDGWGEVIVGTETGVQVFAASDQVVRRELWQSPRLGFMAALFLTDLDGDGLGEVLAGSTSGRVYALADEGHILWEADLKEPVWSINAGDVDGTGRREIVVGTWEPMQRRGGGQVHLLDGDRLIWSAGIGGGLVNSLAVRDIDGDDQAEIVAGSGRSNGQVVLLDGAGEIVWQRKFDEPVTAVYGEPGRTVDGGNGQVLVGTESGLIYRLAADGSGLVEHSLGAKILSLDAGRAATADGRIYELGDGDPIVIHDLGEAPIAAQLSAESAAMHTGDQELGLVARDGSTWKGTVNGPAFNIAAGDLNGDGEVEIAVSTEERVHLFGPALNQPPLITEPSLVDTRTGYTYSVNVNDPDGDAVALTLEVWDPSTGVWLTQPAGSLAQGQGQGRLVWDVPGPFDTWDSGQESRFRFRYDDGRAEGTTGEIPGPFAIPTTPWYGYYGQRVGLGALFLMIPALILILYLRQRTYRQSPVGQAEALLRELRAGPDGALVRLHDLGREDPEQLTFLSGLARQAGEAAIADVSEGFHLTLTRPEVTSEGLRLILSAAEALNGSSGEQNLTVAGLYGLFHQMLEANTISRIVAVRSQLHSVQETVTQPDPGQADVAEPLAALGRVADTLLSYQQVNLIEQKTAFLDKAMESLDDLSSEVKVTLAQPEQNILSHIASHWRVVVAGASL